jgi:predicted DNA-binding protein (UPF0251 family)
MFAQYRNLKNYNSLSDEELLKKVKEKIALSKFDKDFDIDDLFTDNKDKKLAKALRNKYLEQNTIENISEKQDLRQVIFYEILAKRYQEEINKQHSADAMIPSKGLMEGLQKITLEISRLKSCLGLDKKEEQENDALKALQLLKKRFLNYVQRNQGSFTKVCPHCSKPVLWMFRTDKYDVKKHPFFDDERTLTNPTLLRLLGEGKITKKDVADILDTSVYTIDWILKHTKQTVESLKLPDNTQITYPEENIETIKFQ